ncbi:MAG: hypothetical protein KDK44_05100 [Chlamydiia bacterium]|nr:hypothetical protein [Chlamydiia bacterium]
MIDDLKTGVAVGLIVPAMTNPLSRFVARKQALPPGATPFRDFFKAPFRGSLAATSVGLTRCVCIFALKPHLGESKFISGGLAGAAASFVSAPLSAFCTRLYVQDHGFFRQAFAGSLASVGFHCTYWGVYFGSVGLAEQHFITANAKRDGAIGGVAATAFAYPLKVLSTNQRVFQGIRLADCYKGVGSFGVRGVWAGVLTNWIVSIMNKNDLRRT